MQYDPFHISIHAPRVGSDATVSVNTAPPLFQSTLPAEGATFALKHPCHADYFADNMALLQFLPFYPLGFVLWVIRNHVVSIHAPVVRSDCYLFGFDLGLVMYF